MYSTNFTTFNTAINPLFSPSSSFRGTPIKAAVSTLGTESARVVSGKKSPSLYEILRVEKTASQMEIKTAYRSLAKVYHPDVSGTMDGEQWDGSDFIVIRNAYETLSDPVARAVYDLSLGNVSRRDRPVGFSNGYYRSRRWETDQCW